MPLPIDVMLTELQLADDFLAAVRSRVIPEKFFYWFPLSVRAWLALCGEGEYRNFSRSQQVIQHHAADVAARMPGGPVDVVSLGAGQGDKDRIVLAALARAGHAVRYRPVDASIGLLEIAVRDAAAAGFATRGIKADLASIEQLEPLRAEHASSDHATRLFLLLGNTLGGFDPMEMARRLAALMRAEDLALVDGELFAGDETLAGYDNPINRRFAFAPLAAAGLCEADGELVFATAADDQRDGVYRVVKHFTASRPAVLRLAGEAVMLEAGERLDMSPSHKYDEAGYLSVLEAARLDPHVTFRSGDGRLLMTLVRRQP
ncbi:MAG TPA: L-histidine N(alpha)-methyltransferase [Gemmatimonadaceae bacterium]|nr:L-histidine N(alpha)-methyltransferase [Gemmatimonadaceae bacterium]